MKKVIGRYGIYFEPLILITALIIAMLAQSQLNMFFYWLSFSLLLSIGLWRLCKPELYFSIVKDKVFLAYSIFILWGIISCLYWSVVKVDSIITIVIFLAGLLTYFIGFTDTSKQALSAQKLLLVFGIGLSAFTYYQFFVLEMKRPTGLLSNWNTHAAFLAMIILPWVLSYALKARVTIAQLGFICTITLIFSFAMGLTQSRGALLILAVGICCLIVIIKQRRLSYKYSLFLLVAIILGYMLSGLFINETVLQRIGAITEVQTYTETAYGRHLLWLPAWNMYLDRPFLGWGLGAYAALFAQYKAPLTNEFGYYAHNDYLQFLLELGPVGLALFLVFVFFIAQKLYFLLKKEDRIHALKKEAFILITPCIGMLIHAFFTFNLYQISMQIIFAYYLGRAVKCVQIEQGLMDDNVQIRCNEKFNRIYYCVSFVGVLLIIIFGFSAYHMNKGQKPQPYPEKIDHYLKAGLFFIALDKYDALSARYYANRLQNMPVNDGNIEQRKQIANYALQAVNRAIEKMPLQTSNYITKAEIFHSMQSNYSLVCEQYIKALDIDPYLLEARYHLAQLLAGNGQNKQGMDVLSAGWGLLYNTFFQTGINFLLLHQELNDKYGTPEDGIVIGYEIQRLEQLMENYDGGQYVFLKSG